VVYQKYIFRIARFTNEIFFLREDDRNRHEQIFLDSLSAILKAQKIDIIMQPTTNVFFNKVPNGSIFAPFGSYRLNLTLDVDSLWKNVHGKHKNVIRNADKKGICIIENNYDINEIYNLIAGTFKRSKMNFMSFYKFQNQIINLKDNVRIFVAKTSDGLIQGCAVIHFSNYSAYYLHGGSVEKPITGAMNYLQWNAIIRLKELGVPQYDFVGARINVQKGSKLEGIQKFKERFGATLYQGYLWKNPIVKWKYWLFQLVYKIIRKSEGDIIDQERRRI
jgi:lipid II:glycine glycyltransferase (peptidoglycan interpeptide bridge formation enzyme)